MTSWLDALIAIFIRQRELMDKYKLIEQLPEPPVSLHAYGGQRVLKDFAWRVVEEMGEAYAVHQSSGEPRETLRARLSDELADALHFLVELMIFAGITPQQVKQQIPDYGEPSVTMSAVAIDTSFWKATFDLADAMHELRNKPWKKTPVPTDEGQCRAKLISAFESHLWLWRELGFSQEQLFQSYFHKSAVNKARQEGSY